MDYASQTDSPELPAIARSVNPQNMESIVGGWKPRTAFSTDLKMENCIGIGAAEIGAEDRPRERGQGWTNGFGPPGNRRPMQGRNLVCGSVVRRTRSKSGDQGSLERSAQDARR